MISTQNLTAIPERDKLYQICKSVSVLDAIFSEKWIDRYYSFNSKLSETEELFSMLNGEGDELLILFLPDGCVMSGIAHEYYPKDKFKLINGLPQKYREFIYGKSVDSLGRTFCIWLDSNSKWTIGEVADFNDGSSELLEIFDVNPDTYFNWAKEYFEVDFPNSDSALETINKIYQGEALTKEMVSSLNPNFEHWQQLEDDLKKINYPSTLGD